MGLLLFLQLIISRVEDNPSLLVYLRLLTLHHLLSFLQLLLHLIVELQIHLFSNYT